MLAKAAPPRCRMNKLECDYSEHLEARRLAGEITAWKFEPFNLRLAPGASYKPDFLVVCSDGILELHETKGFWREAARLRIKVAAEAFPWFRFLAVQRKHGQWITETF